MYSKYPTKMEVNGRIYDINTDYRVALACLKAIDDNEISDTERFYVVEALLLGTEVREEDRLLLKPKIEKYLRCGRENNTSADEIDMDYFQDERYIKTSIKQVYHGLDIINIEYLHWWEFNDLIEGLTSECILDNIRGLRTLDLNDIKDEKTRKKLQKAKEEVSLNKNVRNLSKKEQKNVENFYKLAGLNMEGVEK